MTATEHAHTLIEPYGPRVPIAELVEELNRLYHAREAEDYDGQHPEIHIQLMPIWRRMLEIGLPCGLNRPLRVLDFGCGTGFEAEQILRTDVGVEIGELVCYDLSPEMLALCRRRLDGLGAGIRFTSDPEELASTDGLFDILMTNSLLHHLPDPIGTIHGLLPLMNEGAVWLGGHEPSSRYYRNAACQETFTRFRRSWRLRKYLSPKKYWSVAKRTLSWRAHPARVAASAAVAKGLLKLEPPAQVVSRLVDFHVAHSVGEADAGRGFDFRRLEQDLSKEWTLQWRETYSYMGPYYEGGLPGYWRGECDRLKKQFPDDGHNFCVVWKRRKAA
ncbi:MAG: class I SAM-dependent methyltransferase [Pirellulales bacterium]|nr:class I SAM-dependent methyltransferase [Pirellulales bacterium]